MKNFGPLCMLFALALPVIAAAQSASTQPARQRTATVDTRENVDNGSRDGSRANEAKDRYDDANAPGNSGNSNGKKGEAPGQEKKDKKNKKNK